MLHHLTLLITSEVYSVGWCMAHGLIWKLKQLIQILPSSSLRVVQSPRISFTLSFTIINYYNTTTCNNKYFALQGSRRRRRVRWSSFVHVARLKIGRMMGQDFLLKLFLNKHFLNSVGAWAYVGYKPWWIRKQQTFLGVPHNLTPLVIPPGTKNPIHSMFNI